MNVLAGCIGTHGYLVPVPYLVPGTLLMKVMKAADHRI